MQTNLANLTEEQLAHIESLEQVFGIVLVAYEKPTTSLLEPFDEVSGCDQ